jgi:hypothetical protein
MTLLDTNFIKIILDGEVCDLVDEKDNSIGTYVLNHTGRSQKVPMSEIHDHNGDPFLEIYAFRKHWSIESYDVKDSDGNLIGKMKTKGIFKGGFFMENSQGEEVLSLKGLKTILDTSGNVIGDVTGPSYFYLKFMRKGWTLTIRNPEFDRRALLGFFFSIWTVDSTSEINTTAS